MKPANPVNYQVECHILSPVHIGTGEELDPFSYIIRDKKLFIVDTVKWIESYPDKKRLYEIMNSDNFASVRSFIADNFDAPEAVLCEIAIEDNELIRTYHNAISKKDSRNQVIVEPVTRNPVTMAPYIPGSSIKGAIRTAIANQFVKIANVTSRDSRGRYNDKIFGPPDKDPMKHLKIKDIPMVSGSTVIMEAIEFSKNPGKSLTPKGHKEVVESLCQTGQSIVANLTFALNPFFLHNQKIDVEFILKALRDFYVDKYKSDLEKFFSLPHAEKIRSKIEMLTPIVENLKANEAILRIGHFSHVESVTLDNVRAPRTRRGKDGRPLPWGTTRTLANGLYPFGWVKLEFIGL